MFYCFLVLFNYIFYVNESTGSWHGDLKGYKHKNLLIIFLFTCKVASGSTPLTFANLLLQGCGTGRYIELHVWFKSSARTGAMIICLCFRSQANLSPVSLCL